MTKEIRPSPYPSGVRPSTSVGERRDSALSEPRSGSQAAPAAPGDRFEAASWVGPAGEPTGALIAEGARLVRESVGARPETARQLEQWSALSSHRAALVESLSEARTELARWREEHGGVDSMARLAVASGTLVSNLAKGKLKFWEGAGKVATNAETTQRAPMRDRVESLTQRIAEVDAALKSLADGDPLTAAASKDYVVAELAGAELGPKALMASRLQRLKSSVDEGAVDSARELYAAVLEPLFEATTDAGEGLLRDASGKDSVTAAVNRLVSAGVLEAGGRLVTRGEDLPSFEGAIERARGDARWAKEPKAQALLAQLTPEALAGEAKRLSKLQKSEPFRALLPLANGAQEALARVEESARPGFLRSSVSAVTDILDSPETWAMLGAGKLVAGLGGRLLFQKGAVGAAELAGARKLGTLSKAAVGKFAAGTAVDGVLFHAAMNGFNIARGKAERASWGAADFARSVLLFEALGGLRANALARELKTTALGRAAAAGREFSEELGAFWMLGAGEAFLRDGNFDQAGALFRENLQFLVAMRMVGGLNRLARTSKGDASLQELRGAESQAALAEARYRESPTREHFDAACVAFRQLGTKFDGARKLLNPQEAGPGGPAVRVEGARRLAEAVSEISSRLTASGAPAKQLQALEKLASAQRHREALSPAEASAALGTLLPALRPAELTSLRDSIRQLSAEHGELSAMARSRFDGASQKAGDLAALVMGSARKPLTMEELGAAQRAVNQAELRVRFELQELLQGRTPEQLLAEAPARHTAEYEPLKQHLARLDARKVELSQFEKVLRQAPAEPHREPLEAFHHELKGQLQAARAELVARGEAVPARLTAKLQMLDRVVSLQKRGKSLSKAELSKVFNELLVDLNPAQLTAFRDALKATQQARGDLAHFQQRRLPGLPGTASEVATLLLGLGRTPTSAAEARSAMGQVAEHARQLKVELAKLSPDATGRDTLARSVDRLAERYAELQRYEGALSAGEVVSSLTAVPRSVRAATREQRRLERRLGAVEARLQGLLGAEGRVSALPADRQALAQRLVSEKTALHRARQTLSELRAQLGQVERPSGWSQTGAVLGFLNGRVGVPGVLAAGADLGVKFSPKDVHTGQRQREWWSSTGTDTAVGSVGYFRSATHKGQNGTVSAPYVGVGVHPVLGRTAFTFIPGLFRFQVGSAGALSILVTVPTPVPGFFLGGSLAVTNPALANVTGPLLNGIYRGVEGGRKLGQKLEPYLGHHLEPAVSSARERAAAARADGQALASRLKPDADSVLARARALSPEQRQAQFRKQVEAGLADALKGAGAD